MDYTAHHIDLQALLRPCAGANAAGDSQIEWKPAFIAANGEFGGIDDSSDRPKVAKTWRAVNSQLEDLLAESKNLRVSVLLARALVSEHGLSGLADGIWLNAKMLETFWEHCYPTADEDEPGDFGERAGATEELGKSNALLRTYRSSTLIDVRGLGRVTPRDILVNERKLSVPEGADYRSREECDAVMAGAPPEVRESAQALIGEIAKGLEQIEALYLQRAPAEGLNLAPLKVEIDALSRYLSKFGPQASAEAPEPEASATTTAAPSPSSNVVSSPVGEIGTRQQVIEVLDALSAYYALHEPFSPVPHLLSRSRKLVNASFLEILREIAPSSLEAVQKVLGDLSRLDSAADADNVAAGESQPSDTTPQPSSLIVLERQAVIEHLDRLNRYYQRRGPSSPIPELLKRARKMVNASFFDVLSEISPDSIEEVESVLGKRPEITETANR